MTDRINKMKKVTFSFRGVVGLVIKISLKVKMTITALIYSVVLVSMHAFSSKTKAKVRTISKSKKNNIKRSHPLQVLIRVD